MKERLECVRCRGAMEPGFLADVVAYRVPVMGRWHAGTPERTRLGKMKGVTKESGVAVVVYRCRSCGRLESFAPVEG